MNESNIKFLEAVKLFNENFFWDAIELFQDALSDGLEDKFVDDCFLNIAICYMQLNLFNEAQEFFLKAIDSSKIYGDKIDSEGAVYGKTSDRAKLGLIRILLAKNDVESAKEILDELKDSETYIEIDNKKESLHSIAFAEINLAKK